VYVNLCKKNNQAVKNGVALKSLGEKVVKSKVAAKKWPQTFKGCKF